MYECESWTLKKAEHRRIDAFELLCWRRLLRVAWTARKFNQSNLKEISPEYSLEGLFLKLKLQYFDHLMWRTDSFEKDPDAGKDWRWEEKGTTEGKLVGWHHQLDELEFEQVPGVGDGQGSLSCCNPWVYKESDITEWLYWTDISSELLIIEKSILRYCSLLSNYEIIWILLTKTMLIPPQFLKSCQFPINQTFLDPTTNYCNGKGQISQSQLTQTHVYIHPPRS